MARVRSMLGIIEGSAGGLTFASQNGKNILRQKVGSNSSNSPAQQVTRSRFKLLSELYKQLSTVLQRGLLRVNGQSAYNRFVGQNFEATSVNAAGVAIMDYAKMVLSAGSVEPLTGLTAQKNAGGGVAQVSFDDNSNGVTALPNDEVVAVLVNKKTGQAYTPGLGALREDGSASIEDARLIGVAPADLQVYAFALRANGSDASATREAQVA